MRIRMRIFLIGMLVGVMIAAAFTYTFAIPANNYHWQSEIWKRGGDDKHFSYWHAVRSDDSGRIHVRLRNSGEQLLLENGNLETRRRSVDVRQEKWPHGLEMAGSTQGRYAASKRVSVPASEVNDR